MQLYIYMLNYVVHSTDQIMYTVEGKMWSGWARTALHNKSLGGFLARTQEEVRKAELSLVI
uniref:Uncharacterized protein n=1 Tax=Arundo donax TaxID=35708 RepID=A0A0A9H8B9_ARUDO